MPEIPFPWVEVSLVIGSWDTIVEAYVDSGFEGGLAIPQGFGREILAHPEEAPYRLADGKVLWVRTWRGRILLEDHEFSIDAIELGPRFLLGRDVLDQLEVCFEFGERLSLRFRDEVVEGS